MTTPRQHRRAVIALAARCGLTAEHMIAWLVLLALAFSFMSSATGHGDIEGKAKNGVRRAASQLERKFAKSDIPAASKAWLRIG